MSGFQVMPRLTPEEYSDLEADIVAHGVQVPITVSQDGTIVDGHHRDEIARKHDLHCPRIKADGTDAEMRGLAFSLNLNRRHLNREQRRELIAESLRSDPELSNREHARRTGASKTTVNSVRDEMQESGQIDHFSERVDPRTGNLSQSAERPRSTFIPQDELDALNTPPEPEDDPEPPEWEHVAQLPDTAVEQMKQDHTPIRVPDEDETEKDRLLDLMTHLRKATKELEAAVAVARRVEVWDQGQISSELRGLLNELDNTLTTGGLDGELARLIEGKQS